jgi:hypothetical protein
LLQNVFAFSLSLISAGFVGHLNDPVLLSAAVLANSLYNITGLSVVSGLASGMETLCGQVGVGVGDPSPQQGASARPCPRLPAARGTAARGMGLGRMRWAGGGRLLTPSLLHPGVRRRTGRATTGSWAASCSGRC